MALPVEIATAHGVGIGKVLDAARVVVTWSSGVRRAADRDRTVTPAYA